MKKRLSITLKVSAFLMTMVILLVNPAIKTSIVAIGEEIGSRIGGLKGTSDTTSQPAATSHEGLEDIKPPDITENPYSLEGNKFILPVYTSRNYEVLRDYSREFTSYERFYDRTPERSQYFTGSVLVRGTWQDATFGGVSITSDLPYNELSTTMFHPELTLKGEYATGRMTGTLYASELEKLTPDGSSIWNYLDEEHTRLVIGGNLIHGSGSLYASAYYKDNATVRGYDHFPQTVTKPGRTAITHLKPGENYFFKAEFPYNSNTKFYSLEYVSSINSVITDPHAAIIDDYDPYIKDAEFSIEKGLRDDESDLVLTVTLNEGIRFISDAEIESGKDTYIVVYVWNKLIGDHQKIRLFLSKVDGSNKIEFRANIGKLHYIDFHVTDYYHVTARKPGRRIDMGAIDLADKMVVGADNVIEYGHGLRISKSAWSSEMSWSQGILCDHAGNDLDLSTISSLNLKFEHTVKAIEADEVKIYNDKTLGVESGEISSGEVTSSDMFVGPDMDMTVRVKLNRNVNENVWKQMYIKLNVFDSEGNELKLYPTSAVNYVDNEVYANGTKKGTMLIFKVTLDDSMQVKFDDGEEPIVMVTSMGSDYDPEESGLPPIYPYVDKPYNIMYADFTAPIVEVRKTLDTTILPDGEDGKKYYKVSIEVSAEDKTNTARSAGLVGAKTFISVGGGVEKATKARYVLSTDPIPPEDIADYEKEITLVPDALVTAGGLTMLNEKNAVYVHMIVESGDIYLNQLEVSVSVFDMANNECVLEPTGKIEYIIDEISPAVSITGKSVVAEDGNTTLKLSVNVSAEDHTRVDRVLYYFGDEALDGSEEWQVAVIEEFGASIKALIERKYGDPSDPDHDANKVYTETLWVKAVDTYGNESEPVSTEIILSLQKPDTKVTYTGDPNAVSRAHKVLVSGPDASLLDGTEAYTRVTLTPVGGIYSYATLVKTGEKDVDVLALKGLDWYRVQIEDGAYVQAIGPLTVEEDTAGILEELLSCYGELKISFENGYGNMIPTVGDLSQTAVSGSYFADPNYYTVRYASPLITGQITHGVDFGAIVDYALPFNSEEPVIQMGGTTVVPDADKGAAPYVFNQQYKGVNPMRNAQIHFTISNIANGEYGLLDVDFEKSYAELMKVSEDGEDVVVATQNGLWATESQYFTVQNTMDNGEYFTTGVYYLRVAVADGGGEYSKYESSRIILDAQTADNAGLWEYSYKSVADITNTDEKTEFIKTADEKSFEDIGFVVMAGGETGRDRNFATYSYGVEDIKLTLSVPDSKLTLEGITIGEVEGFKIWNLLSAPTDEEIATRRFELTGGTDTLQRAVNTNWIRTSETIPKGIAGLAHLYLVKGTNTICYQVKMKNGYVSPVKQFTVTVTDEAPTLSVSIDSYQPSAKPSQVHSVINADHVRYFIDTAYSVNGTGNVNIDLWSTYDMNLGLLNEDGEIVEIFTDGSTGALEVLKSGMKAEEYADFTENSYTANFPRESVAWCSAVFVATDEYGGVSIVAPQLGDMERINVNAGVVGNAHEIDISYYASYFNDPYLNDTEISWRRIYNQPTYFGAQLLSFETYLEENTEDVKRTVLYTDDVELRYNNFNIETNDISLGSGSVYSTATGQQVNFKNYYNQELVLLSDAKVTLSGGYITEPVTVDFLTGDVITEGEDGMLNVAIGKGNTVGYAYGYSSIEDDGTPMQLTFFMASPPANEDNPAGNTVDISYTFEYSNIFGDKYQETGVVTLTYVDYKIDSVDMTESGAKLNFSFEAKDINNAGVERTGMYDNGTYEADITDYFGRTQTYTYTVDNQADLSTSITYKKHTNTSLPVKITLSSTYKVLVDVTDYEVMNVEYGEGYTTVTVTENTRFSYRYVNSDGDESMYYITVDNIFALEPKVVYTQNLSNYHVDDDGTKYLYGDVTVYLADNNFILKDKYTGKLPSYTFTPGGPKSYTFSKDEISAVLGDETIELTEDITVVLDVMLYEATDIDAWADEDTETPNVQVKAFSKLGEEYSENRVSLKLMSTRNSTALSDEFGYEVFEYVGNRANMSEVLERLGWSTVYRFTVETVDSSRVRLFIKEGLYAEAPDYETGRSDRIEGVELNSKLLTVSKNAKFTLFVVDSLNNSSSIAFNITNISAAPIPEIVKIPMGHDKVRVYVMAPEGVAEEDLTILTPTPQTDTDTDSLYYLKKYVELTSNDDYTILYEIKYNGTPVRDALEVSVTEINLDEITQREQKWSFNKSREATANAVTVEVIFSHNVAAINATSAYDPTKVSFISAGNTVKVTFTDNHPSVTFAAIADNGTYVEVILDSVTNIDKTAPEIALVSETLAANGRSVTLVLSSNERATFREGYGRVGEEITDSDGNTLYHYTVTLTRNGEYSFTFSNMSGIQTVFEYTLTKLVLDELDVLYNTAPADAGAATDPEDLELEVGDVVFIKPERNVTAAFTGIENAITMTGGEWFEFEIPATTGGIPPYVIYTDTYGNTLTHQFTKVEIPDTTAPEIVISKHTYPVRVGTLREDIEVELMANFVAFDDKDATVALEVEFTDDVSIIGLTDVIYKATDSAGNTAVSYGKLRITSIYEPVVYIGEERVIRDGGINLRSGEEITLNINTQGVAYKVILATGKRTAAQLKTIEALADYSTAEKVDLGVLNDGIYTILIITEQRDYFRILISVEDY